VAAQTDDRVLNEHREVCAFVLHMLIESSVTGHSQFVWLDLGSGDGRVLRALRAGTPDHLRAKVRYLGCDRDPQCRQRTREEIQASGLARGSGCDFQSLDAAVDEIGPGGAHLVTMTNVAHEIEPAQLPEVLLRCVEMLDPSGCFLAYDVERQLEEDAWKEPLAITWRGVEITEILQAMLGELGAEKRPVVGTWIHARTSGWTAVIPRTMLSWTGDEGDTRGRAVHAMQQTVDEALDRKLKDCRLRIRNACDRVSNLGALDAEAQEGLADELRENLPHLLRQHLALSREDHALTLHLPYRPQS
jgi:hypothetical protein